MKRSFLIIAILVVTLLSACKKHYDDYQITGIVMQRIEIDDSNMKENNLYLLEPIVEYNYSYEFILSKYIPEAFMILKDQIPFLKK